MTTKPGAEKKTSLETLAEVVGELIDKIDGVENRMIALEKTAVKKSTGLFGGKRGRVAIKDTKTGLIYASKSALGKALATEADTDGLDHFAWYKLTAKFPERFVEATEAEAKTAWDAVDEERKKEVEEANKRLAAEEAAKAKAKK